MSQGEKMPLDRAKLVAKALLLDLGPFIKRGKVVGSVRRERPQVGDIEVLVEPLFMDTLLGDPNVDVMPIRRRCAEWGTVAKGGDRYLQVAHRDGFMVEVYMCYPPAQWGSLLAIRTGPADLGHLAMMLFRERGLAHRDGGIYEGDQAKEVPDEETFFGLAGIPLEAPHRRDALVDRVRKQVYAGGAR